MKALLATFFAILYELLSMTSFMYLLDDIPIDWPIGRNRFLSMAIIVWAARHSIPKNIDMKVIISKGISSYWLANDLATINERYSKILLKLSL
jgi:hypothetical protein